jgi:H+/gluconate symporter-like permease
MISTDVLSSLDNVGRSRDMSKGQKLAKVIGKSILLAGFLVALASVEMSSRFSVLNFSKSDEILQNAANALSAFMFIGTVWAFGSTLVLYSSYETIGMVAGIISNGVIMAWVYFSYKAAFDRAARENNLTPPKMFQTLI